MAHQHDISVNGVHLAYRVHGDPSAPPMVLLHALGETAESWAPVVTSFAKSFQVFTVDLRGHGNSEHTSHYSFDAMCNDVVRVLEQLQLENVTLIGHSMGGVVAYLVAIREPALVRSLVVEDVSPPYERDHPTPATPDDTDSLGFDWAVVPAIVSEVNAGDPEAWASLTDIEARTLIIGGGPDSHIPQERLSDVASRIPCCDLVTIKAGHHVHTTEPQRYSDAVLDWLEV